MELVTAETAVNDPIPAFALRVATRDLIPRDARESGENGTKKPPPASDPSTTKISDCDMLWLVSTDHFGGSPPLCRDSVF